MSRLKTDAIRNVNASVDGITLDTSGNVAIPNELQLADKIVHTGDTNTFIRFPAADTVSVETAGSERLRIDASGRLLLGTTIPSGYSSRKLTVAAADDDCVIEIRTATDHAGQLAFSDGYAANGTAYRGYIQYDHSSDYMRFATTEGERLRINSGGQVLIGTSSNPAFTNRRLTVATSSGTTAIEIRSAEAGDGRIIFTDSTSSGSPGSYKGQILYDQSNDYMSFNTNGNNERLRITSAGKLWVATTTDNTDAPVVARCSAGYSFAAIKDNTAPSIVFGGVTQPRVLLEARHNANTLQFHTATGSTYASPGWTNRMEIESNGNVKITDGNLYIGTSGHGIDFSVTSNASGMTSELLSDYEEGTWTGAVMDGNTNGRQNISINNVVATYRKIGKQVTCWFNITRNETGSRTGQIRFNNSLPFTSASGMNVIATGTWWLDEGGVIHGDSVGGSVYIINNTTQGVFVHPTNDSQQAPTRYLEYSQWSQHKPIYGSFTYYVD